MLAIGVPVPDERPFPLSITNLHLSLSANLTASWMNIAILFVN
jgi:hypothetical protein